jgi:hypothetical protein
VWCWCSGPMAAAFSTSSSAVDGPRRGSLRRRALPPIATTMHLPFVDKLAEPAIGKVLLMGLLHPTPRAGAAFERRRLGSVSGKASCDRLL